MTSAWSGTSRSASFFLLLDDVVKNLKFRPRGRGRVPSPQYFAVLRDNYQGSLRDHDQPRFAPTDPDHRPMTRYILRP